MTFPSEGTHAPFPEQAPPDVVRSMLAQVMQAALQQEFDRFLGAGRWERKGERRGWRNGSKRRRLHTRVGTIELRVPKDREHDHAEIRRRTRVVRIFPNDASLLRLISALAVERNEKWMERRYLIMPEVPRSQDELRQPA